MQHALGLARGAGGVEDEEGVLGVHLLGFAVVGDVLGGNFLMPPGVPARLHVDLAGAGALDHDHVLYRGAFEDGFVGIGLERYEPSAAQAFVGRDDHGGLAVLDAVPERLGRESAEHDAVDRSHTSAGQHGYGEFGDHGEIDGDAVAFFDALLLQHVGKTVHLVIQLLVGVGLVDAAVGLPDERCLVPRGRGDEPVEAVHRGVQFPARKPLDEWFMKVVLQDLVPFPGPREVLVRHLAPELLGLVNGPFIELLVLLHALDVGFCAELL